MLKMSGLFLVLFSLFIFTGAASGGTNTMEFKAGAEVMTGYTLYRIGGSVTAPDGSYGYIPYDISQLKFPLSTFLITAEGALNFSERFHIGLRIKKSFTSSAGKMEDSDWGYWMGQGYTFETSPTLDIFSLSDSSINFFSIEGLFLYTGLSGSWFSIAYGGAFLFQYIYFDISNLDQWYPSYQQYKIYLDTLTNDYSGHIIVPGRVMTYEERLYIPCLALKGGVFSDIFRFEMLLGYTPFAFCSDHDDHLLRYMEMNGSSSGSAFIARADLSINFTGSLSASLNGGFLYMTTRGTQSQYQYKAIKDVPVGPLGTIGYKQESMQFNAGLNIGIGF